MAKMQFKDLPVDIQSLVVDKISDIADLRNVCLVNKQFHHAAAKCLYRHLSLQLGTDHDSRLAAMLDRRNIGLQYIRRLDLDLMDTRDRPAPAQQAHVLARMVVMFLPEDILEEFSWQSKRAFSGKTLIALFQRQRKLKHIHIASLDRDLLPQLTSLEKQDGKRLFQSARSLALLLDTHQSLHVSQFVLERMSDSLEELSVRANVFTRSRRYHSPTPPSELDSRELNDSSTRLGLLSQIVFKHKLPFDENCKRFKSITSLTIGGVSLRYCGKSWCKFVDFREIKVLRIFDCTGADSLLAQLSKAKHLPQKLQELQLQHKDNGPNETLHALDGFLCQINGIRRLTIDLGNVRALPAAAGIKTQSKGLVLLNVHGSGRHFSLTRRHDNPELSGTIYEDLSSELVYTASDFDDICKACTRLQQLSCAWPSTVLLSQTSDQSWVEFEQSLCHLQNLRTLHISTWPTSQSISRPRQGSSIEGLPKTVYLTLLQSLALRTFELAAGKRTPSSIHAQAMLSSLLPLTSRRLQDGKTIPLRLLAFGLRDPASLDDLALPRSHEKPSTPSPQIYLRSTAIDANGQPTLYAAPLDKKDRQLRSLAHAEILAFKLRKEVPHPWADDTTARQGRRNGGVGPAGETHPLIFDDNGPIAGGQGWPVAIDLIGTPAAAGLTVGLDESGDPDEEDSEEG